MTGKKLVSALVLCLVIAVTAIGARFILRPVPTQAAPVFVNSRADLDKIPIVKRMLTANANYTSLHAVIDIDRSYPTKVLGRAEIWIAQPNRFRLEDIPDLGDPSKKFIAVSNGTAVQVQDPSLAVRTYDPIPTSAKPANPREDEVIPDYNGTYLPVGGEINSLIHPELVAQSVFKNGTLSVLGQESMLNRNTTVVRIDLVQSKLGTAEKYWIDTDTGIVLQREIYDHDNLVYRAVFRSFDLSSISLSQFSL